MPHSKKKRKRWNPQDINAEAINEEALSAKRIRAGCLKIEVQRHKVLTAIKSKITEDSQNVVPRVSVHPRLDTNKVIYIVYNTSDNMRYIGHTSKDATHRFMEHLRKAKQLSKLELVEYNTLMKQKLLYTHMVKIGLEGWYVYPIEQVQADNLSFKTTACERELFWIKHFGTLTPHGLNMILPLSPNHTLIESKVDNIALDSKVDNAVDLNTTQPLVVYPLRRFESRNFKKKLQRLNTLIDENKFDYKMLDKYKLKNINTMLNILDNTDPTLLTISPVNAQLLRSFFKQILNKPSIQSSHKHEQLYLVLSAFCTEHTSERVFHSY